ncbi:MAG: MFS transporter [Actinobacteria bacterium]|nr:MFS transporter [Actinomycetota bacterium]
MTSRPAAGRRASGAATGNGIHRSGTAHGQIRVGAPARGGVPRRGLLPVLGTAEFMLVLDLSIVNVALPRIQAGLGFTPGGLAWVVNAYALTFGGFLLLGGRAADLFGGRRVFLTALSVFTLASLACGLAGGPGVLIAARAVQGLSAGVLSPATLSILTAVFTAPRDRNRALSIWTAVAIGGGAAGAIAGGVLTGLLSWRWIFFVNVPVGAGLLAAAWLRLPRTQPGGSRGRLDLAGAVTVTGGLVAITWALIGAQASGWASAQVTGGLAAGAVLLGVFALVETRVARAPLVPFPVFRSRLVSAGNALSFLSFLPAMAIWFLLTLYLQDVRGFTALQAGLVFLPMSLAVAAGTQASFMVITRADTRLVFLGGGLTAAGGAAWLTQLAASGSLWAIVVPACLAMAGGGLMFAPIMTAATTGLPPSQGGLASGLLNTSRQAGGALGLAILASVAAARTGTQHAGVPDGASHAAALAAGFSAAFGIAAGIFAATAMIGALILPRQISGGGRR